MRRIEAKALGLTTYDGGKPCVHGHTGGRYTSSGSCAECIKIRTAEQVELGYFKELHRKNHEKHKVRDRRRYLENRDLILEKTRAWAVNNPEKRKSIRDSYRHRRRVQELSELSTEDYHWWVFEQAKVCYWCSDPCEYSFHVDHFYPLSKGGKHELYNLVIACPSCNLRKSAKDPQEFAQEIGKPQLGVLPI